MILAEFLFYNALIAVSIIMVHKTKHMATAGVLTMAALILIFNVSYIDVDYTARVVDSSAAWVEETGGVNYTITNFTYGYFNASEVYGAPLFEKDDTVYFYIMLAGALLFAFGARAEAEIMERRKEE